MKKHKIFVVILLAIIINLLIINVNASATPDKGDACNPIFAKESTVGKTITAAFEIMRWGAPIALIILGSVDFGKAVIAGSQEAINKATKTFVTRLIIAVFIFLSPAILDMLFSLLGTDTCGY